MSIVTTNKSKNFVTTLQLSKTQGIVMKEKWSEQSLTISSLIRTMLEIIKIEKFDKMDEGAKRQFPKIAREILRLAEQIN